ncbi:MAG: hypothetical protein Kow0075_02250 [Salibacteraceae bacterium]
MVIPGLVLFIVVSGCKPDDELYRLQQTRWSPELVSSVASAQISVADILIKSKLPSLEIDDRDRVVVVYGTNLLTVRGADLLKINDLFATIKGGDSLQFIALQWLEHIRLHKATIRSGLMELLLLNSSRSDIGRIVITIENLTDPQTGLPFTREIEHSSGYGEIIRLNGFQLNFDDLDPNVLAVEFRVFDKFGVDISEHFNLLIGYRNMLLEYIEGFIDGMRFGLETDSLPIDLFRYWKKGEIFLHDPMIELSFRNSIGFPLKARIATFQAVGNQGLVVPIDYAASIGDSLYIGFPGDGDHSIHTMVDAVHQISPDKSNLGSVISIRPDLIRCRMDVYVGYDLGAKPGYIRDTSRLSIDMSVRLPLTMRIDGVEILDTIPFAPDLPKEIQGIDRLSLEIETENHLPIGLQLQGYFLNRNGTVIDSLFESPTFLEEPDIGMDGKITKAVNAFNRVDIERDGIERISDATSIALFLRVNSGSSGEVPITFYATNHLRVDIRQRLQYRVQ